MAQTLSVKRNLSPCSFLSVTHNTSGVWKLLSPIPYIQKKIYIFLKSSSLKGRKQNSIELLNYKRRPPCTPWCHHTFNICTSYNIQTFRKILVRPKQQVLNQSALQAGHTGKAGINRLQATQTITFCNTGITI